MTGWGLGFTLFLRPGVGGGYWTMFFPAMLVLGLGLATTVAPLTTTVMESVDDAHAGVASGVNNAVSRVAGLLAIAVLSIVMLRTFGDRLDRTLPASPLSAQTKSAMSSQRTRLAAVSLSAGVDPAERARARAVVSDAFVAGFRRVMLIASALAVLSSGIAFAFIRGAKRRVE